MQINLLEIIKTLPVDNFTDIGYIVTFSRILEYLALYHGMDNQDILCIELNKLAKNNLIKIHHAFDNNDETDVIIGVSLK
ncbi:hypothetical protein SCACP_21730 [Sporomusa carbonis]|uniref:hypothetical protein n=1 Tax=Sporomusa carbonis TaxID=3076075 RepID=UPI003A6FBCD1